MYTTVLSELDGLLEAVQEVWRRTWTEIRWTIMEAKLSGISTRCGTFYCMIYIAWHMKMMFAASYIACPCVSWRCVLSANRTMPSCGVLNVNPIICSVDCDQDIHWMDPLHDREIWKDGFFQFVPHILPLMFNQWLWWKKVHFCAHFNLVFIIIYFGLSVYVRTLLCLPHAILQYVYHNWHSFCLQYIYITTVDRPTLSMFLRITVL